VSEVLYQQDRLQLIVEKRKWQTEIENKKRQLEDDRRALQHLKSKALRDRWLLEGASAGPEQNEVCRQLEQDEARTRSLEETIDRSEPPNEQKGDVKVREELGLMRSKSPLPQVPVEITGLEAKVGGEPSVAEASTENPVTMVFMGYQSVEDEDETKKVLGLQGTVKAELVHIDDPNGKTSGGEKEADPPLPTSKAPPTSTKPPMAIPVASNGETAGKEKEKKPCKCCSIM
uniref:Paralemmin-1 n=1 Tax=Oreochromis niloticus TaxID=8128 RepID=A0A669BQP6_ORENI